MMLNDTYIKERQMWEEEKAEIEKAQTNPALKEALRKKYIGFLQEAGMYDESGNVKKEFR